MSGEIELERNPEVIDPHSIAIVTTTSYPDWVKGGTSGFVKQVRGDAVIDMAKEARRRGYQMVVVDGNGQYASPEAFRDELRNLGVKVIEQTEPGMAASRRQDIKAGSELPDAKVVVWSEEKPSLLEDNDPETLAGPIIRGEAEIIIYNRGKEGMASYNPGQAKWENKANEIWNKVLKAQGLTEEGEWFDAWSGPRAIKISQEIINLFMDKYQFEKVTDPNRPRAIEIHKRINPERWSDSIFLPVVKAKFLHKNDPDNFRVLSRDVFYRHRETMNESERENDAMLEIRKTQFFDIVHNTIHFINYLKGKHGRISPA